LSTIENDDCAVAPANSRWPLTTHPGGTVICEAVYDSDLMLANRIMMSITPPTCWIYRWLCRRKGAPPVHIRAEWRHDL